MKKEEFLAMSLPFGLKMYKESLHGEIETPYKLTPEWLESALEFKNKPILRQLSDLTKPIEHNGEKFVPIVKIKELFIDGTEDVLSQSIEAIEYFIENNFFSRIEYLPFILIQKLIEWHFAVGLDKTDYIDVNTLEVNPYK